MPRSLSVVLTLALSGYCCQSGLSDQPTVARSPAMYPGTPISTAIKCLSGWQLTNLGPQLAVQGGEAGVRLGSTQVGRHAVSPQLAPSQGCGGELESIEVDAYAEDAPRLTVEINRASRSTGSGPANRIELFHDPASPQFTDQVGHRGDAEPAAACNVVTAASSMVAHVAKDLGEISLA